jgi:hypothetical protein
VGQDGERYTSDLGPLASKISEFRKIGREAFSPSSPATRQVFGEPTDLPRRAVLLIEFAGISLAARMGVGDIVSITMKLLRKEQSLVLWCFSASLLLSSCGGAGPECGSLDTRNSVVKIVSDDNNNKLVNYAVKNSSSVAAMVGDTKSEAEKLGIWEKARQGAVYRLDDTVLMNSRNRAAQEVTCIGLLYVTVADATAQKELEFKVKQTADGKIIVSVNPFLF